MWIDRRTAELPGSFATDARAWLLVLLGGDTRARPRSHAAIYSYFGSVRPHLHSWAATRGHLREITRTDVTTAIDPLRGWQRHNAITALRSLFRFAKKHGLVFADPTTRLKSPSIERHVLPMTDAEIRSVEQTAAVPAERLIVASPRSTPPAPQPSDNSGSTTSTYATGASRSPGTPSGSAT